MTSFAAVVEQPSLEGQSTGNQSSTTSAPFPIVSTESKPRGREKQILRVRAAGFPRRLAASLVDLVLVIGVSALVALLAALVLGVRLPSSKEFGPDFVMAGLLDRNPMVAGALGLFLGMSALYQIYLGGMLGQTLGKRLFRLRLISYRGQAPGPILACVRSVAMGLSLALAGLGFLWCLFDRERRALHDHLSGTYVILDER